jgi:hypothetical protein
LVTLQESGWRGRWRLDANFVSARERHRFFDRHYPNPHLTPSGG